MKTCVKCGIEKDDNFFVKEKNQCKDCKAIYNKLYKQQHKEEIREYNKIYDQTHTEEIKERRVDYLQDNKKETKKVKQEYYRQNQVIFKNRRKKYYIENRDEEIKKSSERKKQRRLKDPVFKLRDNVSISINTALRQNGFSKNGQTILQYLGYSIEELKKHLEARFEAWMTWENHGIYKSDIWNDADPDTWTWQLDHIIPHSDLPYISMEDANFKKAWALENLRPLSAKQNLLDGSTRARHLSNNIV